MEQSFNINEKVKVKLTNYGKEILAKQYLEFWSQFPEGARSAFKLPEEDEQGWSEWQLWDLMKQLGKHLSLGFGNAPFETTIKFITRN